MTIIVEWANDDQNVLLVNHIGQWTWEETFAARDGEWSPRLVNADHPVHLIFDYTQEIDPPTNFSDVMFKLGEYQFPKQTGLVINVGLKGANKLGSDLFSRIYHKV